MSSTKPSRPTKAVIWLARLAAAEGRREEARAAWERVASDSAHPRQAEALTWLGGDLIRAGDPKGARARLDEALDAIARGYRVDPLLPMLPVMEAALATILSVPHAM